MPLRTRIWYGLVGSFFALALIAGMTLFVTGVASMVDADEGSIELPRCEEDELIGWVQFPPERSEDLKCVHPDDLRLPIPNCPIGTIARWTNPTPKVGDLECQPR